MAKKKRKPTAGREPSSPEPRRRRALPWAAAAVVVAALVAAVLLLPERGVESGAGAAGAPPPGIILITIDTLRADALGFAGNREVETPFLDRLASGGLVFTNAHAHNVVTLPSHVNILTGLLPYQHGVRDNSGYVLDREFATVAPLLKKEGWATGAFIAAYPLDARYGLTPGFDVYDDRLPEGRGRHDLQTPERPAEEVLAAATAWWNAQQGRRFMWVHLFEPHAPYAPAGEFASRYRDKPYLGEVAYLDSVMAKFLEPVLRESPSTMLIVTSDHGESLHEHGEATHGLFAYEATLKVPLLVHEPGVVKAGVDGRPARHIDLAPTILARAGIAVPEDRLGRSLLAPVDQPQPTYFEALSASLNRGWAPLVGLIEENEKYIDLPLPELYDLERDPGETRNLVDERRRVVARMRQALAAAAPAAATERRVVSGEEASRLLSLGYVSGTAAKKTYTAADDPKNLIEYDRMLHEIVEANQAGRANEALETARELVRRQPEMPLAREMLSFVLQEQDRVDEAIATLQEARSRGVVSETIDRRLGLLLSETGRAGDAVSVLATLGDSVDVDTLNAYGISLADVGRHGDAMRQFERVLAIDATNATAHQNLGIAALRAQDSARALTHLNRALELDPNLPLALNTLGVLHAQSGRPAEAIRLWSRAVAVDPQLHDALFNMAMVSARMRRWDLARPALERFIRTAPPARYGRDIAAAREMLRQIEADAAGGVR
ncbi:MAG TPA: sulfatase-like hydrolase/transferase [Thermoanaerobaculia bacterium]|nr:sulfatase-like hydrolase/transferase [Thermoanaerobaculia bacterium]